jgi:hypothetical protein
MPSKVRLAGMGVSFQPKTDFAWCYTMAGTETNTLKSSGLKNKMIVDHVLIGGITPTSVGNDTVHRVSNHSDATLYFDIRPGASSTTACPTSYRLRLQVPTGLTIKNTGTTAAGGETFFDVYGESLHTVTPLGASYGKTAT